MAKGVWSPRAVTDYLEILGYLQREWGTKVMTSFTLRIDHALSLITNNPHLFVASGKRRPFVDV